MGAPRGMSLVLLTLACGATPAPVAPSAPRPPTAGIPSAPITNDPTVLTDEQLARDRALTAQAGAIVDAYANVSGALYAPVVAQLTKDGKHLLYASQREGLGQIYLGDITNPSAVPVAVTRGSQRAGWASLTRDEKAVVFMRDDGADENWRIYRAGLDGSNVSNLTPGPTMHREWPLLPRGAPDLMIYAASVKASPKTQVFVQAVSGGEPKVAYEDERPCFVVDASPDGKRALLVRLNSPSDKVLLEIDIGGRKAPVRVYPPEGVKATVQGSGWSPDAKTIYVATDEGKEGGVLLALDAKEHGVRSRWIVDAPPTAATGGPPRARVGLSVSPTGDRVAVRVDAGTHDEVRILDARTLVQQKRLDMPLGRVFVGDFSDDGKQLTYVLSTPERPADVFVADAATGESTPLRDDERPGLRGLPPIEVTIQKAAAFDGLTIPLNLYLPRVGRETKLPTIVSFHGGPQSSSAVRWSDFTRFFTAEGFAVVEPNIRGSTGFGRAFEMADDGAKRSGVLEDMKTVNAWVKAQPWCDADRVVVFGPSYGGYVVLLGVTRQPALWRAGVDLFGIVNLETFLRSTDAMNRSAFVTEFGDPDKDAVLLREYSPSRDFDKIVAPMFVYAGQNDPRVPRSESDQLVVAMRRRGIPVEYMVASNEGHSLDHRETKIEFLTRVTRFLGDQMK